VVEHVSKHAFIGFAKLRLEWGIPLSMAEATSRVDTSRGNCMVNMGPLINMRQVYMVEPSFWKVICGERALCCRPDAPGSAQLCRHAVLAPCIGTNLLEKARCASSDSDVRSSDGAQRTVKV
jgi:hypothetical protein